MVAVDEIRAGVAPMDRRGMWAVGQIGASITFNHGVYGDDVGLSAARARRAMESIMKDPVLSDAKAEHEGRGYVQSDDVVNAGFIEGQNAAIEYRWGENQPDRMRELAAHAARRRGLA